VPVKAVELSLGLLILPDPAEKLDDVEREADCANKVHTVKLLIRGRWWSAQQMDLKSLTI
jgi:hypothetical protein